MCFVFSLIAATIWLVIGYFVLFSSSKAEGGIAIFGQILAIWIFVIAAGIFIAGAYATLAGFCPMVDMFRSMHSVKP